MTSQKQIHFIKQRDQTQSSTLRSWSLVSPEESNLRAKPRPVPQVPSGDRSNLAPTQHRALVFPYKDGHRVRAANCVERWNGGCLREEEGRVPSADSMVLSRRVEGFYIPRENRVQRLHRSIHPTSPKEVPSRRRPLQALRRKQR